jgi:hypothetical protein
MRFRNSSWNLGENLVVAIDDTKKEIVPPKSELALRVLMWTVAALLMYALLGPFIITEWVKRTGNVLERINLTNPVIVGPSALCPGDMMIVRFDFDSLGEGVLEENTTWFKVEPPMTLILSEPKVLIVPHNFSRETYRAWEVPKTHINERTGREEPIPPGEYLRMYSLSSPNRSTIFGVLEFPVTVKEGCSE